MRFLVDAQLPERLARMLTAAGHDAVHTSELPKGNRSRDREIASLADREDRVVVTKDADFRDSHRLGGAPRRLLIVSTGNVTNDALIALFATNRERLVAALEDARFVELDGTSMTIYDDRS